MLLQVINLLVFPIIPLVSVVALAIQGDWLLIGKGVLLIVGTIYGLSLLYPLERRLMSKMQLTTVSRVLPVYYLFVVYISIVLSWTLINSAQVGNWSVFLFAYTCCYYPYNYMLGAESAKPGRVGLMTNVINNYAIEGYLLFGFMRNFMPIPASIAYIAPAILAIYPFYYKLPERLMRKY